MFNAIVAISKNKGIGINNKLPWKLNNDMSRFKILTVGNNNNSIIMGYNTWKSINKILPNRHMYILSTTFKIDEVHNNYEVKSFDDINTLISYISLKKYTTNWVIGGAQIYKLFFDKNLINSIYITLIDKDINCDIFLPPIPKYFIKNDFRLSPDIYDNKYKVYYVVYQKIKINQQLIYKKNYNCIVKEIHYDDLPDIYITISYDNKEAQTTVEKLSIKNSNYL